MKIHDKMIDEKVQYDINRETAKISALSSDETEKYEYFAGEEILPSDQGRIKEQLRLFILHSAKYLKNK